MKIIHYKGSDIKTLFDLCLKLSDNPGERELTKTGERELTLVLDPLTLHQELQDDPIPYYPESIYSKLFDLETWILSGLSNIDIPRPGTKNPDVPSAFRIVRAIEEDVKEEIRKKYERQGKGSLVIAGDFHGNIGALLDGLREKNLSPDSSVICVGELCKTEGDWEKADQELGKLGLVLYVLSTEPGEEFENIKWMAGHEVTEISRFLVYSVPGQSGNVVKKYADLPRKVDIIVSQESPFMFYPVPQEDKCPVEVQGDRKYLDYVLSSIRASSWYFGKYDNPCSSHILGRDYKSIGRTGIIEI